jgi:glucose-1-phosphate thymidylyltransferase
MKAIVLAAGEGTRLGPFTHSEPKVMIPVANRPIVEYVVEELVGVGMLDIVLVVGYQREKIQTHFGDGKGFGAKIQYVVQGKQLGTGHALLEARQHLQDQVLVLPGDNIIDSQTVNDALAHRLGPAVVVTTSEEPGRYGVVEVRDGQVAGIMEKPGQRLGNIINTGIYALDAGSLEVLEALVAKGHHDLPDLINALAQRGKVQAIFTKGTWGDAVYPWDLLRVNAAALRSAGDRIGGKVEQNVVLRGPVSVGDDSVLHPGTFIQGPVAIGAGCEIGPNATIHPSTSIGDNVRIGASSVVEESIIMRDGSLGPHGYLSHGVLGKGVQAGSHLAAPAGRADVRIEGEWFDVPQVGTFVGEDTILGHGAVVEPGTIVGARCKVGPQARLRGVVPHGSTVV